jgi:hypothetical protein
MAKTAALSSRRRLATREGAEVSRGPTSSFGATVATGRERADRDATTGLAAPKALVAEGDAALGTETTGIDEAMISSGVCMRSAPGGGASIDGAGPAIAVAGTAWGDAR